MNLWSYFYLAKLNLKITFRLFPLSLQLLPCLLWNFNPGYCGVLISKVKKVKSFQRYSANDYVIRSSWLNRALRVDEHVYWVSMGQQWLVHGGTESAKAVPVGNWCYIYLIFVSAWYGFEGDSTRKIDKCWDFQPFIAVKDNKRTSLIWGWQQKKSQYFIQDNPLDRP